MEDFDFDPEVMVPAMRPGDPGYQKDLDASLPRDQRARAFHKSIVFTIAPNSILAMNAQETKMLALQNFRMGVLDFWSYHEAMETPNVGAPPPIPLPPLKPIAPELIQLFVQQMASQPMMPGAPLTDPVTGDQYVLDPMSGQLLQIRVPLTIVERLIAQAQLGLGTTPGPAAGQGPPGKSGGGPGRPASGQAPPKMEQKSDGRTTVTESRHTTGPNG
jgi:hypothetical protein